MKRLLCLVLFLLPSYAFAADDLVLGMPDKLDNKVGRLIAINIVTNAKSVTWAMNPGADADVFREYDPDPKVIKLRLITYREGSYYLTVAASSSNGQLLQKTCIIGSQAPIPPPDPTPTTKVVSLTFVVLSPTDKTAAVTEDVGFRAWLKSNNVNIYGITKQSDLDLNPYFKNIQPPPCIVLQDVTNNVIGSASISTVADAKAYVTKYLGGK